MVSGDSSIYMVVQHKQVRNHAILGPSLDNMNTLIAAPSGSRVWAESNRPAAWPGLSQTLVCVAPASRLQIPLQESARRGLDVTRRQVETRDSRVILYFVEFTVLTLGCEGLVLADDSADWKDCSNRLNDAEEPENRSKTRLLCTLFGWPYVLCRPPPPDGLLGRGSDSYPTHATPMSNVTEKLISHRPYAVKWWLGVPIAKTSGSESLYSLCI